LLSRLFRRIKRTYDRFEFFIGIGIGVGVVFAGGEAVKYTSTDDFCALCHMHPQATYSWKRSTHYKNESGVVVHCRECHLPPGGLDYFYEKSRFGVLDAFSTMVKDNENIDWEAKSVVEHAVTYTFDGACLYCHTDLYSLNLSPKGVEAHEYYMKMSDRVHCINCHITVGHYQEAPVEEIDLLAKEKIKIPSYQPDTGEFVNYTETIPGSDVTFNMIAIPGGEFLMGSPETEAYHEEDEEPRLTVRLSPFWIGEIEVSWREFEVFYARTATPGKDDLKTASSSVLTGGVDAISGPTPPYGAPDQGWGRGLRPAITMTHNAAMVYCEWLSRETGTMYRLPTEAEWEYACRAGTGGAYFFGDDPARLTGKSWKNRLFGTEDAVIDSFVYFERSSGNKTGLPYVNNPNPWGLYNMLGNVREFCLDWYTSDAYAVYGSAGPIENPRGPDSGTEHVVRGGSYAGDPIDLRSAARDHTQNDRWLLTDPQSPKSVWWYSDVRDAGFRIVREYAEGGRGNKSPAAAMTQAVHN